MDALAEEEEEVPVLKLVTGGKSGSNDWLTGLPVGTVFTYKSVDKPLKIKEVYIAFISRKGNVKLTHNLNKSKYKWAEPPLFCIHNKLVEVLAIGDGE